MSTVYLTRFVYHSILAAISLVLLVAQPQRAQNIQELRLTSDKDAEYKGNVAAVSFPEPWSTPYRPDSTYAGHFMNSNGKYLYVLNKVAFSYFGCAYPEAFLTKTAKEGINVIRVCLEGNVCRNGNSADLWPWSGSRDIPKFNSFNDVYWNTVEERIALAGEMGIGIHLVLYHSLHPQPGDIDEQKAYWANALERLGKYHNLLIWEVSARAMQNEDFVDEAGMYFVRNDPAKRAVIATGETSDKAFWVEKPWMDLAVATTRTGKEDFFGLENWYLAIAKNLSTHGKPILNTETGSESLHNNDDPVYRRKQMWLWCASGGYWTWNSLEGCREMQQRTYYGAGWQYLKPLVEFFEASEFWKLHPDHTTVQVENDALITTSMSDADKSQIVTYVCTRESNDYIRDLLIGFRLPEGTFEMKFIRPSDNHPVRTDRIFGAGSMVPAQVQVPDFSNDLVIRIDRLY